VVLGRTLVVVQTIEPGPYRHFKGGRYEVVEVARDSETELPVVVYRALRDGSLWVRSLAMFTETVLVDGVARPRFERDAE